MSCLLRLFNPETEETIEILVSKADAQRAETVAFSFSSNNGKTNIEDDATPSNVGEALAVNGFKWPHEAILLLVDEFRKEQTNLISGRVSQKKVWDRIAQVLQDKGHIATGPQCLSKFNGMKRTYKSIKDHNGKPGNNLRSWPYLDLMESMLGEKPFMQPVATLSSTATGTGHASTSTTPTVEQEIPNSTRKRKAASEIAEAISKSRILAEESKEKRHRERMTEKSEFQEKMLQLMGGLIDKV